nr:integrase, catalytic region, zinc finger, CCHC-type, peptidase aspartic, catalytic [Tanacetum cinerariifolium]
MANGPGLLWGRVIEVSGRSGSGESGGKTGEEGGIYGGNANKNVGRNKTQGYNTGNACDENNQIIQHFPRTKSTSGKANVQCYNCNKKGHYARECQKPKVHDSKYFREQMLLAIKDEAGSNLSNEEKDLMIDTSYGEELEELTATVMYMLRLRFMNKKSSVKRALFTSLVPAKSKSLGATSVVSKSRFSVAKTPIVTNKVIQLVLWIVDSGCLKHMTGNLQLLRNFIKKFMGTVYFGNDHFAAITGYGDYVQGNLTICHVYYVEGIGHNLFSIRKFCDGDLEVAFRSNTCYVWNLKGDDLLTGS